MYIYIYICSLIIKLIRTHKVLTTSKYYEIFATVH